MSKFHISKDGIARKCTAKGVCPLGGDEVHFTTKEEAQEFGDRQNTEEHGLLPGIAGKRDRNDLNKEAIRINKTLRTIQKELEDVQDYDNEIDYKLSQSLRGEITLSDEEQNSLLQTGEDNYDKQKELIADLASNRKQLEDLEKEFRDATKNEVKIETKIRAYNSSNIPIGLTGFVTMSGLGNSADQEYFDNIVRANDKDAATLVKVLNSNQKVTGHWEVDSEDENAFALKTQDAFKNDNYLTIKKEEVRPDIKEKGRIIAYGAETRVPMSLSNYASNEREGSEGSRRYFENIIKHSDMNAGLMVAELNADKRIFGKWEIEEESFSDIKLKQTDSFGNVDYINISTGK